MIGPGKGGVGPDVLLDRATPPPKMLLKVWDVKDPRRAREEGSLGGVVSLLLLDMLNAGW